MARDGSLITGVRTNQTTWGNNGVIGLSPGGRVVLAAGTYGSARILLRSGIGQSDLLNIVQLNSTGAADLPPPLQFIDLPVGSWTFSK